MQNKSIIENLLYIMDETEGEKKKNKEREQILEKCENMYEKMMEQLNKEEKNQLYDLNFELQLLSGFEYDEGYIEGFKTAFKLLFETLS